MSLAEVTEPIRLAHPPLKWAGGKRQLLPQLQKLFPKSWVRYHEPFLGGGAVFFHFATEDNPSPNAVLSDSNRELINVYETIRDDVHWLIKALKEYAHDEETFYAVRAYRPEDLNKIERASRFIYLNRTCFNGLYRVNKQGRFNVPFGKYENPLICDAENLHACAMALEKTELHACDFEQVEGRAAEGDFIYFDPPYIPLNKTSSFTAYGEAGFEDDDQLRLRSLFRGMSLSGVQCMLSNSDTPRVRELYKDFHITEVQASRAINSKASGRGKIKELVITSYNPKTGAKG